MFGRKGREAYARRAAGNVFLEAVMTRLRENQQASRNMCIISFARRHEIFNVQELGQDLRVDLKDRHYDCGNFQTDRYPCHHVTACSSNQDIDWTFYIDPVYSMDNICKVYEREFEAVGHHNTWLPYHGPRIHPNPELKRTMKGRSKSTRFLNEMDMFEMRG